MTTIISDSFVGTAGDDIDTHTPDTDTVGAGWVDGGANTVELDGSGGLKFAASADYARIDSGLTDAIATVNWTSGGADNRMQVELRASTSRTNRNAYGFNYRQGDAGNELKIYEVRLGVNVEIGTAAFTNTASQTYEMEMSVIGSSLEWKIDGVSKLTVTDTAITTGTFVELGHYLRTDANGRFNDIVVANVGAAITSVGGDDVVLDAELNAAFITTGFASEISTVQLVSGTSITNATGVTSTSGTGDFDLPDITLYTGDVIGCPLTTANNVVVARLTDA